jgi:hypothetical protein
MTLDRVVSSTVRRIRCLRALEATVTFALAGLGAVALVLLVIKLGVRVSHPRFWLTAPAFFPLLGGVIGWVRPVSRLRAALVLDRAYGLHDRISSALSFARLPDDGRSAFMQACMADAAAHASRLSPGPVLPVKPTGRWAALVAAALGVSAIAVVEPPPGTPPPTRPPVATAALLSEDDIESLQNEVEATKASKDEQLEVRKGLGEFNRLVRAIAESKLSHREAIRRIGELERQLREGYPTHLDEVEQELRLMGRKLGPAPRPLYQALTDADAARAKRELDRLAQELKADGPRRRASRNRLRRALRRAANRSGFRDPGPVARRRKAIERLLRRRRTGQGEPGLFESQGRKRSSLEREREELERGSRELDRLNRHLDQASQALAQGDAEGASSLLGRAGQRLGDIADEQAEARANRRLRERLAELRDMLSWQGQRLARGTSPDGKEEAKGRPLTLAGFAQSARRGNARSARGSRPAVRAGQGEPGNRSRGQDLLAGTRTASMPSKAAGGSGAGSGTASERLDQTSRMSASHLDSSVKGDPGEGPVRSQVIPQSADSGFVSSAYRHVYADYRKHAETVLETDVVPPGYRFYVKRYFRLIRPREER